MSSTVGEMVEAMADSYAAVCEFYEEADKLLGESRENFIEGVKVADDVMKLLLQYGRERIARDRANPQGPGPGERSADTPPPSCNTGAKTGAKRGR
jgi:hypothetical protein